MNKKHLLLVCLSLCYFTLTAQQNFTEAKLITLQGDTLRGYIDYRNWKINPDEIAFKKQLADGTADSYKPLEIGGFVVAEEIYLSAIVDKEMSSTLTKNLTFDEELNLQRDTTFLQALVFGQKSLFYLRSDAKDHFYIGKDGKFDLLTYKRYLKNVQDPNTRREVKAAQENLGFRWQLINYLQSCNVIYETVSASRYEKGSLMNVFKAYYNCEGEDLFYNQIEEDSKTTFAVMAGVTSTSISFEGSAFSSELFRFLKSDIFSNSLRPTFGVSVEKTFPRQLQKLAIKGEVMYSSFLFDEDHFFEGDRLLTTNAKFGFKYLKFNGLVKYAFVKGDKVSFFADAGISLGWAFGEPVNEYTQLREFPGPDPVPLLREGIILEQFRNDEQSVLFGVGASYLDFSAEVRAEIGNGMQDQAGLTSTTRRIMLLFSYTL